MSGCQGLRSLIAPCAYARSGGHPDGGRSSKATGIFGAPEILAIMAAR